MNNFSTFSFEDAMIHFLVNDEGYRGGVMPILQKDLFNKQFSVEMAVYECIKHMQGEKNIKLSDINYVQIWINLKESGLDESSLAKVAEKFESLEDNFERIKNSFSLEVMLEKTEEWAKSRALHNAVYKAATILDSSDQKKINSLPELFSDALNIRIDDADNKDITESVIERYWMRKDNTNKIPFLIKKFNMITKNGLPRKSLSCFVLPTGGGKTAIFCSLAADYLRQGYNVLFITLELAKEILETRIDANITNTSIDELEKIDLQEYIQKCKDGYDNKGKIIVKEFPTSSVNTSAVSALISELKQKKGFVPDVIFLDYINLINPTRKVDDSSYTQIKAAAEELRGICVKNNMVGITGTQINREGIKNNEAEMTDVSESMGLPFTLDLMIGGFATQEQRDNKLIFMKPTKNRFSGFVNTKIMLELDFEFMRLRDLPESVERKLQINGSQSLINNSDQQEAKSTPTFRPMR